MKGYAKIRLAVFLCIMLVLPSIVSVLPMTSQEVSAASDVSLYWNYNFNSSDDSIVQVEKGEKFNVGDYAYISEGDSKYGCASQFKNAKYSSSKKSVMTVSSKGVITAKKTGKATITIKYKGKKIKKTFQVVKAGTFSDTGAVKGVRQRVTKLSKNMPSKITLSNGYKYLKMVKDYYSYVNENSTEISTAGMLLEESSYGSGDYTYTYYKNSNKLAVPQAGRFYAAEQLLYKYANKYSPTSTTGSKRLKISSASANTKEITVKTKQKVTASHMLSANITERYVNNTVSKKKVLAYVSVHDETTDEAYVGMATLTKGSKTVKIKVGKYTYNSETERSEFTSVKLKKGHTYLIGNSIQWGGGKKVKVK